MDATTLLARLDQAREFTVPVGDWSFRMRLPTDFACRRAAMAQADDGPAATQDMVRQIVQTSVLGWTGPTVGALLPDAGAEADTALPFTPATCAALLDHRLEVFDALITAFAAERRRRDEAKQAALKNSTSA